MSEWTLEYAGEVRTLAGWGLARPRRRLRNQSVDTLLLELDGAPVEGERPFAAEGLVRVFRDGQPWFLGVAVEQHHEGRAGAEGGDVVLAGPWWHLENLVYQQQWQEALELGNPQSALAGRLKSSLILGQDANGLRLGTGAVVTRVLEYAIARGAPLAIGTIDAGVGFPPDEVRDLSCAEAIQRVLRWTPDAVVWLDYGSGPYPTLHVSARGQMEAVEVAAGGEGSRVRRLRVNPRPDLRAPAVVIHYEKTHRSDESVWSTTETDAYPPGATGEEVKALVLTVELEGARANTVSQRVETDPITESNSQWWKQHLPALDGIPSDKIVVAGASRESTLPNELVEGQVADWMNVEVEADVVRASLSWESEDEHVVGRRVSLRLTATDASTRTYRQLASSIPAEPTPSGVARRVFDALGALQYEGEIELEDAEIDARGFLGSVVNLTGLRGEWAAMRAQVQSVDEDLQRGRTLVRFGPALHLGAADLIERLRVNRGRRAATRVSTRVSGQPDEAPPVDQPTHGRLENAASGPGRFKRVTWVDPQHPERLVRIDAEDIPQALTVRLREEDVCDGGQLRKRLALVSEPYDPQPEA